MRARGPDAEGEWTGEGVVLGHRRLAIVDLDHRADQPMATDDGRYRIVFNGEIYNYRELRRELSDDGVTFKTTSDTEVLLALFVREGLRMLARLHGMFAFALWDTWANELVLARDPYGIKPLYYAQMPGGLVFASQVKALVASGLVATTPEPAGLAGFFLWGSVPEPWTCYRGILALPAGHWLRVRFGVAEPPIAWHDIRSSWQGEAREASLAEVQERVRNAVTDSVRAHLVADVPVSVFLSGGIDSGAIAGLAHEAGADVEGITVGFEEFSGRHDDEMPVAAAIARHYGLRHHVRVVSRSEFEEDLPRILNAMDQPSIDGVNTWFASKAAADRGYKVVLSGVGGDELMFGYSSFRGIPRAVAAGRAMAAVPGGRAMARLVCGVVNAIRPQPKLSGVPNFVDSLSGAYFLGRCLFLPTELPALVGEDVARDGLAALGGNPPGVVEVSARSLSAGVGMLESTLYLRNQLLRDSDWASMAHSLELRTPLVDAQLLAELGPYCAAFEEGRGKSMLAHSPVNSLPAKIVERQKTGFGIPLNRWLRESAEFRALSGPVPTPHAQWARQWARFVMSGGAGCA